MVHASVRRLEVQGLPHVAVQNGLCRHDWLGLGAQAPRVRFGKYASLREWFVVAGPEPHCTLMMFMLIRPSWASAILLATPLGLSGVLRSDTPSLRMPYYTEVSVALLSICRAPNVAFDLRPIG